MTVIVDNRLAYLITYIFIVLHIIHTTVLYCILLTYYVLYCIVLYLYHMYYCIKNQSYLMQSRFMPSQFVLIGSILIDNFNFG